MEARLRRARPDGPSVAQRGLAGIHAGHPCASVPPRGLLEGAAPPRPARKQNSDICGGCRALKALVVAPHFSAGPACAPAWAAPLQQAVVRRLKRWPPGRMPGEPHWAMDGPCAACHLFRCVTAGTPSVSEGPMWGAAQAGAQAGPEHTHQSHHQALGPPQQTPRIPKKAPLKSAPADAAAETPPPRWPPGSPGS